MSNALVLAPDFLLIVVGFLVCRHTALNRGVWEAAERLVYDLLFPVLLFNSIVRSPLQPAQTLSLAAAGVCTVGCGIGLAFALRRWPGVDLRRSRCACRCATWPRCGRWPATAATPTAASCCATR